VSGNGASSHAGGSHIGHDRARFAAAQGRN